MKLGTLQTPIKSQEIGYITNFHQIPYINYLSYEQKLMVTVQATLTRLHGTYTHKKPEIEERFPASIKIIRLNLKPQPRKHFQPMLN